MGKPKALKFIPQNVNYLRLIFGVDAILLLIFSAGLYWLWRQLPVEGVKLHGTVDVGVDLLGNRNDLIWLASLGILIFFGNCVLSVLLAKREKVAALYLLIATALIQVLLIGTVIYLVNLNNV